MAKIYGTHPIRRPQLTPLQEEHVLPEVGPAKKMVRHKCLAQYDVKVRRPTPPLPNRARQSNVAKFPAHNGQKAELLQVVEAYIKEEMEVDGPGQILPEGSRGRYMVFRNALCILRDGIRTYSGVMGVIVKELDAYFATATKQSETVRTLEEKVADLEMTKETKLMEVEQKYKQQMAIVLKNVQKTRIDNLLSVEVTRLQQHIDELQAKLTSVEWENRQLIERNDALASSVKDTTENHFGLDSSKSVDTFIVHLSRSLVTALRTIVSLKSKKIKSTHTNGRVKHLEETVHKLKEMLATSETQRRQYEEELNEVAAAYRTLEMEQQQSVQQVETTKKSKLKMENVALKEDLKSNKRAYKQHLFTMHKQLASFENRLSGEDEPRKSLQLSPFLPFGSAADVPLFLRSDSTNLVNNEGLGVKVLVELRKFWLDNKQKAEATSCNFEERFVRYVTQGEGVTQRAAHSHLVNLHMYMKRYQYYADCEVTCLVLAGDMCPDAWYSMDNEVNRFKTALRQLAATPNAGNKDIARVISETFPTKTIDAAAAVFMNICVEGVPPLLGEWLKKCDGVMELVKVQFVQEVRLFEMQIEEGVRDFMKHHTDITVDDVVAATLSIDPSQCKDTLQRIFINAFEHCLPQGGTSLPACKVPDFLVHVRQRHVWRRAKILLKNDTLYEVVSQEAKMLTERDVEQLTQEADKEPLPLQ